MSEERYFFYSEKDEEEYNRLGLQESIFDPVTIRHLNSIGVAEGWKCLEVGAGAGSIARWLFSRVGTAGNVVATDIDARFLDRIRSPGLEVRRHDILKDELEKGVYDLVHCRKALHHLPEPGKAMRKMADAIRPGGWLLVEEDDYGSMLSADITDPSAVPFAATMRTFFDSLRKKGIADYYFGRRVRGLIEELGLVDVGQEGWTIMARGADPFSCWWADSWKAVKPMAVGDIITEEQYDTIQRLIMDPAFYYPVYTLFSAWGRKPAGEGAT